MLIEEMTVTEAAAALDLQEMVQETGGSREVTTSTFIAYIVDRLNYTIERAREMIYRLIELGRVELTNRYTLLVR
jgi:hypothetical protein